MFKTVLISLALNECVTTSNPRRRAIITSFGYGTLGSYIIPIMEARL